MYSYQLLISSASVRCTLFLSFIVPILCMKCCFGISNFLEEISSISYSIVFLYFFSIVQLRRLFKNLSLLYFGTLPSDGYIFPFPLCLLLFFFSQLFVRTPQTTILPFCISFSWEWFWSPPSVQCYECPSIVPQALCLSDLIPCIYLSFYIVKCSYVVYHFNEHFSLYVFFLMNYYLLFNLYLF